MHELEPVFNPRSIAVIGASRREGTIGQQVTKNLIEGKFPGPIYPINPGATEILGLKAYPSIGEVPGPVDAAVYCVPADKVLDVARQCAKAGVKGHIVITSGFAEVGNVKDEEELLLVTDKGQLIRTGVSDIRIAGRATQGVILISVAEDEHVVAAERLEALSGENGEEETSEGK